MTIQYNHHVSTSSPVNVIRLSLRWQASVWKAVFREVIVWILLYETVANFYAYGLNPEQQSSFRKAAVIMNERMSYIPLEFILGFFVSAVVKKWTDIVHNLGYLDDVAVYVCNLISGNDDRSRMLRRTMVRQLCLTQVLVFRDICEAVRMRFPTNDSIVKAGFMLPEERKVLESYTQLESFTCTDDDGKYWVPLRWVFAHSINTRREGKIVTDLWCTRLLDEVKKFQVSMQTLCNYDWVQIPLAYPQFVFLAVHVYFGICLCARQFVLVHPEDSPSSVNHVAFPIITILQYTFYVGWMKVAAGLMKPFGNHEDDLETNFLIDKNFATCFCIVDDAHEDLPMLVRDIFWMAEKVEPAYPPESVLHHDHPLIGSAAARASSKRVSEKEPRMTVVHNGPLHTSGYRF